MASNTEKRITAKMVLDSTGYNSGLKGINSGLKGVQAEFKLADTQLKVFGKSTDRLGATQQALRKQLELQTKKVDLYKKAIEDTSKKMNANINERNRLKASLTAANVKYQEAIKLYGKESEEAKKAKAEVDRLTQEYNKKKKAVESNAKSIQNYATNQDKANAQMVKTQRQLNKITGELERSKNKYIQYSEALKKQSERLQGFGEKVKNVGSALNTHVTLPIAGIATAAAYVGMNFEEGMSKVSAVSGATGEDLAALKSKAEEMGSKTKFSATEASEGLLYMSMAGWKTNEMLAGLPPILNLATAAGAELGTTSDIVTDALTAFNLKAQDATHFTDIIAAASSNANTDVVMLGESFKYCAPLCGSLGYKAEDAALSLGLMANAGIKGSQSGTALRSIITRLVKPTDESAAAMKKLGIKITDSHGKMKPFEQILQDLRKAFDKLTPAQKGTIAAQLAGQEAMSGLLAIVNAAPGDYAKLKGAITTCDGATKKMADTMQNNAKGSITTMKSALEGAGIKIYEVIAPSVTNLANTVSHLAEQFSKLSPKTQEMIVKSLALAATLGPVVSTGGKLISGTGKLIGFGSKLVGMLGSATVATEGVAAAATVATEGVAAAGAATAGATAAAGAGAGAMSGLGASLAAVAPPAAIAVATIAGVGIAVHKMNQEVIPEIDLFADRVEKTAHTCKSANGTIITSYSQSTIKISEATKKAVGAYIELDKNATKTLKDINTNSIKFTDSAKKAVIKNFTEMVAKGSTKGKEFNINIVKEFTQLVQNTDNLTEKNKKEIVSKYTSMVLDCTKLTNKQKIDTVKTFKDILKETTSITDEQSKTLITKYKNMAVQIENGEKKHFNDRVTTLRNFFESSTVISSTERAEILSREQNFYDYRKSNAEDCKNKIIEIITRAKNKHRALKDEEVKEITRLQNEMKQHAIKSLSETEKESKVILLRIKDAGKRITAEQASECIKNAEKQRQGVVDKANRQYIETVAKIEEMRDKTHSITKDQADKMIKEAERQRNDVKRKAEEQKSQVVEQIRKQNSEVLQDINTTDGSIMSSWDKLKSWFADNPIIRWIKTKTEGGSKAGNNWTGTNNWEGGLTYLHEKGWELYDLPQGTRVYNHEASEQMVLETARSVAEQVASKMGTTTTTGGINVTQYINSPSPTPSEIARQTKNNLQDLALEW